MALIISLGALKPLKAATPPADAESDDTATSDAQTASETNTLAERGIRSAVMMAMAEARLRAVNGLDIKTGAKNTSPNRTDKPTAGQSPPRPKPDRQNASTQSTSPLEADQTTAAAGQTDAAAADSETSGEEDRRDGPTFRTVSRTTSEAPKSADKQDQSDRQTRAARAQSSSSGSTSSQPEAIDVTADVPTFDLSDASQRSALRRLAPRLDLECADTCAGKAFVGAFSKEAAKDAKSGGNAETPVEVAIVRGNTLAVYRNGRQLDDITLGSGVSEVPSRWRRLEVVRLVDDGTLQILCHWRSTAPAANSSTSTDDGSDTSEQKTQTSASASRLHVGLYKVVGQYVGQPFEGIIARRGPDQTKFQRVGDYEFISRDDRPAIRWSRTDTAGSDDTPGASSSDTSVLIWNAWEGVFRPPKPPPTAPDQTS
jgi:hypothetical protein